MTAQDMKTVLVVDDVAENLAMVHALLRGHYKVKVANSGPVALDIVTQAPPDLILLDVMMPGLDGYEVCRRLKAMQQTANIPVIFLTGRSDEADEQTGFDLGAVDYITKPMSPPLVLARVKAQLSLKEARDALEQRNREDTRRFEVALAQQMELNALKSTFVSMTSHEFRTPLATILSSHDMLRHYSDKLDAQTRHELLGSIESAVRRMVTMLDQVLTIGKADAKLLEFSPGEVRLATLCRQIRDEALASQPGAHSPSVDLQLELDDDRVIADEKLLRHVLGNLLSNAIKYSPESASARFHVQSTPGALTFEVADQGIGIPADDLPKLFGNFHRAANVGDIPGTGLGLSIVKRALDSHGGTIHVQSTPGQGTCFTVTIPVTQNHIP